MRALFTIALARVKLVLYLFTMKCLNPDCQFTEVVSRGLCSGCYQAAARLVRAGHSTWKALEVSGRANPVTGATRNKRARWFLEKEGVGK